jgi:hypothetical protein
MYYVLAIVISLLAGMVVGYFVAPDVEKEVAKVKGGFEAEKARIKSLLVAIETDVQADLATLKARVTAVRKLL